MESSKKLKKLLSGLRTWCATSTELTPQSLREEIIQILRSRHPRAVHAASTKLVLIANWYGQYGLRDALEGRIEGWIELDRSLQYLWWAIRIEPSNVMVSRAACCLAHAMSSCHVVYIDWLAKRLINSIEDKAFLSWKYSSFGVFILHLYCLRKGLPAPNTKRPGVADIGPYGRILTGWFDDDELALALNEICNYHLEQTRESLPIPEFVHPPYYLLPVEIIAISRVRAELGLKMPSMDHPLATTPLISPPSMSTVSILEADSATAELVSQARNLGILQ